MGSSLWRGGILLEAHAIRTVPDPFKLDIRNILQKKEWLLFGGSPINRRAEWRFESNEGSMVGYSNLHRMPHLLQRVLGPAGPRRVSAWRDETVGISEPREHVRGVLAVPQWPHRKCGPGLELLI